MRAILIVLLLAGCSVPVYGPYKVLESTCSGGSCRVLTDAGERVTIHAVVVVGDEICHLPQSLPKWWLCSTASGAQFDWRGR